MGRAKPKSRYTAGPPERLAYVRAPNPEGRARLLREVLGMSLLAEMAFCPRLWSTNRPFPTIPALPFLPDLPASLTLGLTGLLVLSVLASFARPRFCWGVLLSGTALVLFDVDRLQPWLFQALLLFTALGASAEDRRTLAAARFIIVATYVWSGLQKANLAFGTDVFPSLLHPLRLGALAPAWPIGPIFETSVGLLLFVPRTRGWGIAFAAALHAFLLIALGPLGMNFNSVVWPWNLGMPLLVFVAFFRDDAPIFPLAGASPWGKALILLAGALPTLNFAGLWDDNLSFSLYSGKPRQAFVLLTEAGARRLPPLVQPYVRRGRRRIGLDLFDWPMRAMNVPAYPELRVYRAVAEWLKVPKSEMTLLVSDHGGFGHPDLTYRVVPDP